MLNIIYRVVYNTGSNKTELYQPSPACQMSLIITTQVSKKGMMMLIDMHLRITLQFVQENFN